MNIGLVYDRILKPKPKIWEDTWDWGTTIFEFQIYNIVAMSCYLLKSWLNFALELTFAYNSHTKMESHHHTRQIASLIHNDIK